MASLTLAACANPGGARSYRSQGHPVGRPEQRHARQAADQLTAKIDRLYDRWPSRLARSRDFPDLALVRIPPVVDRGETGADVALLGRALEEAVRRHRRLRMEADERAVPPSLREEGDGGGEDAEGDEPAEPPEAGLVLQGWIDRVGRVRLDLRDVERGEVLLSARSRVPDG